MGNNWQDTVHGGPLDNKSKDMGTVRAALEELDIHLPYWRNRDMSDIEDEAFPIRLGIGNQNVDYHNKQQYHERLRSTLSEQTHRVQTYISLAYYNRRVR